MPNSTSRLDFMVWIVNFWYKNEEELAYRSRNLMSLRTNLMKYFKWRIRFFLKKLGLPISNQWCHKDSFCFLHHNTYIEIWIQKLANARKCTMGIRRKDSGSPVTWDLRVCRLEERKTPVGSGFRNLDVAGTKKRTREWS